MLSLPVANDPLDVSFGLDEFDGGANPIPHARISALSMEHDDLGLAIDAVAGANGHDELMIARLKKRRLQIRDEIAGHVAALIGGKSDAAMFQTDADMDTSGPRAAGSSNPAESFVISTFIAVLILLVVVLGWSDMMDALNQTLAQIYLLSLLAAANG